MWSNAGEGWRNQPRVWLPKRARKLLGGIRVDLALAVWGARSPDLQTRVLGQDSGTRSVDEQVRSDHDVQAAGAPAARHAHADHPHRSRPHFLLSNKFRLRWRKQRIPRHPHGWSRAEPAGGEPRNVLRAEHRNLARGYARHRLH